MRSHYCNGVPRRVAFDLARALSNSVVDFVVKKRERERARECVFERGLLKHDA